MRVCDLVEYLYEQRMISIIKHGYSGEEIFSGKKFNIPTEIAKLEISFYEVSENSLIIFL